METNILRNGSKGVVNYIMGFCALVAMSATLEVDNHKVDGMCAHALGDTCNRGME